MDHAQNTVVSETVGVDEDADYREGLPDTRHIRMPGSGHIRTPGPRHISHSYHTYAYLVLGTYVRLVLGLVLSLFLSLSYQPLGNPVRYPVWDSMGLWIGMGSRLNIPYQSMIW